MAGKVCVRCQMELRCKQNSVGALEMASFGPAAIYDADLWACPMCGTEMLIGFGAKPISEHFKPDFHRVIDGYSRVVKFWQTQRERDEFWLSRHDVRA
jgi:hypothetical protein